MAKKKSPPTTLPSTTMPGPKAKQPPSSDLGGLGSEYGIDLGTIAALVGMQQTTNDPDVWDGKKITKASKVDTEFYKLDDKGLRDFQERAFRAGLYGTSDRSKVRFGDPDDTSYAIWKSLVDRSAGFQAAGRKVSPWDALFQAEQNAPSFAQQKKTINPLDLKAIGREGGKAVLGQKLTDSQQATFEAKAQAQNLGQQDPNSTVAPASDAGQTEFYRQQIRALDPVRADSRSVVGKFDAIAQLMRGGS